MRRLFAKIFNPTAGTFNYAVFASKKKTRGKKYRAFDGSIFFEKFGLNQTKFILEKIRAEL